MTWPLHPSGNSQGQHHLTHDSIISSSVSGATYHELQSRTTTATPPTTPPWGGASSYSYGGMYQDPLPTNCETSSYRLEAESHQRGGFMPSALPSPHLDPRGYETSSSTSYGYQEGLYAATSPGTSFMLSPSQSSQSMGES